MKDQHFQIKVIRELLWWLFTVVTCIIIMYPIMESIYYRYMFVNVLFIVVLITYFRYIIFYKDILLFQNKWLRLAVFLFNFHLFIVILSKVQLFSLLLDTFSLDEFALNYKESLGLVEQSNLIKYIHRQAIFTSVGSLIMIVGINLRIFISYFRRTVSRLNVSADSSS